MATTTNYGWTTPDNTALVKDGASAIRTLGSSIDTTLKAQIDAQIPDTLLTTTGDVIYASGANTPARLGIGTTGQVLTVSGGLPTWATAASGGMTLLSTTTLSGTSTVVSSINQTYTNLYVFITAITAGATYYPRINPNGTAGQGIYFCAGAGIFDVATNAQSATSGTAFSTTSVNNLVLTINNYASTTQNKYLLMSGASNVSTGTAFMTGGVLNTTSAITSLTMTTTAGTASFTGGTMYVYGVK